MRMTSHLLLMTVLLIKIPDSFYGCNRIFGCVSKVRLQQQGLEGIKKKKIFAFFKIFKKFFCEFINIKAFFKLFFVQTESFNRIYSPENMFTNFHID